MFLTFTADIWDISLSNSLCGCGMQSGEGRGEKKRGRNRLLLPYISLKWIPDHLAAHCDTSCKDATRIAIQQLHSVYRWTTLLKVHRKLFSCKLLNCTTCQAQGFFQTWTSDKSHSPIPDKRCSVAKLAYNINANRNGARTRQRREARSSLRMNLVTHKRFTI